MSRPLNLVEKILKKSVVQGNIGRGEFVRIRPSFCMTHDNTAAVMKKFESIVRESGDYGDGSVFAPEQIVFTLDHNVQDVSDRNLKKICEHCGVCK